MGIIRLRLCGLLMLYPFSFPVQRADSGSAQQIEAWRSEAHSLENGLQLGGDRFTERTTLVRLYLAHKDSASALRHAHLALPALPPDAAAQATYAAFLESLDRPKEALELWRKALEFDPSLESAHFGVTHLLLDLKDPAAALSAADAGLKAAPHSVRIHLAKARAQESLGAWYDVRRTLQKASASVTDTSLLRRLAEVEDTFGQSAGSSYGALVSALEKSPPPLEDLVPILQRGLIVSIRDGDLEQARRFAAKFRTPDPMTGMLL